MLSTIFKRLNLIRLSVGISAGLLVTACSSLNQKPYDVDGIYNNSKLVVEDTHEKGTYYADYFKEKAEESDAYFTDIDNYTSNYNQPNGGWGDTTSSTQIYYNYPNYMGWGGSYWGWNSWNWGMGYGFGFGYGWGGYWGYPYYGWGYPYYGYGNIYNLYRNTSRSNSYRMLNSRQLANSNAPRMAPNTTRGLNRNFNSSNKTLARANSSLNRISTSNTVLRNSRPTNFDDNTTIRNQRFNTNNNTRTNSNMRIERNTTRPTYTPSSSTRMNTGGGMRSGGGSMGGGMRSGGGGRR